MHRIIQCTLVVNTQQDPLRVIFDNGEDLALIKAVEAFLTSAQGSAQLVGPGDVRVDIPEPLYAVLRKIVPLLAQGVAIGLLPIHAELTTQQAADLLNVSRPHLIKLLHEGVIPYTTLHSHRRVKFCDVLAYKERRSAECKAAMAEIIALGDAYGDYD